MASILCINIKDEPQTLDPRKARQVNAQAIIRMLFDGLMRMGKEGKPEMALAHTVEISADHKSYIFHLRESYWSNGERVVAYDFAYAWKKVLSPDFPSDVAFLFYPIKNAQLVKQGALPLSEVGIVCLDDKTLFVELEEPVACFLDLMTLPMFSPVNARLDQENPQWMCDAKGYVSNGPFVVTSWEHQRCCQLKKNPLYWDAAAVHLEGIELEMLSEETEWRLFEQQEIDWAGSPLSSIPIDAIASLKSAGSLNKQDILGTDFLRLNTQQPLLSHVKIRKALGLCIDRAALIAHVTQRGQTVATGLIPEVLGLFHPPYFQDGDHNRARELFDEALAELHLTKETMPKLKYLYANSNLNHLVAQALQEQWRLALGIEIELESVEGKIFFDRVSKVNYDIAFGNWIADIPDPINFLEVFKYQEKGSNNTKWEHPEYIALLDLAHKEMDRARRNQLLLSAEKLLIDEMPIIPLYYKNMVYMTQPHLKGVVFSPMGQVDFKWASIEEVK